MKIVIDITEEEYYFVKKQVADGIANHWKMIIANGTQQLPEDSENFIFDLGYDCGYTAGFNDAIAEMEE